MAVDSLSLELTRIHQLLTEFGGVAGAAFRQHIGFASTHDADAALVGSAGGRSNLILQAREQLVGKLDSTWPNTVLGIARHAAFLGEEFTSPTVATAMADRIPSELHTDLPALLRGVARLARAGWPKWAPYELWNSALVAGYFNSSQSGRSVYLDVDADKLAEFAQEIGAPLGLGTPADPAAAFSRTVARTLSLEPGGPPMLQDHLSRLRAWRSGQSEATALFAGASEDPPFAAVLALFTLAAAVMHNDEDMRDTNYYGRLCDLVGVADKTARGKVQHDFRAQSHQLWSALNSWLRDQHESRGVPTAEAYNRLVHVGVPISQALVREADRSELPALFRRYELNPGQQFAPDDMRGILTRWLPDAPVSSTLKSRWRSGTEAQRRIADVVCVELEHWDGRVPESPRTETQDVRILTYATYFDVPAPEFAVVLGVRFQDGAVLGSYRPSSRLPPGLSPSSSVEVVEDFSNLGRIEIDGLPVVGDLIGQVLGMPLSFAHANGKVLLSRPAKSLIVMLFDESRGLFVESAKAELGRVHLLLAENAVVPAIRAALVRVARPEFEVLGEGVSGLPQGWTLFVGVHIRELLPNPTDELLPLVPLSRSQVAFEGGMQLNSSLWHVSAPPTLIAVDGTGGSFVVTIFNESAETGDEEPGESNLGLFQGECEIPLQGLKLGDGNFRVVLNRATPGGLAGAYLTSRELRLRSAISVHLEPPAPFRLAYAADDADPISSMLSAAECSSPREGIRGAAIFTEAASSEPLPGASSAMLLEELEFGSSIDSREALFRLVPGATAEQLNSVLDTLLRLGFVEVGDRGLTLTEAGRQHSAYEARSARIAGTSPTSARALQPRFQADLDLIADALTVIQGGSWTSLERLIRYSSSEQWEPVEAARNLCSIGYLDLHLDPRTLRPMRWSVAPPTVVVLPAGSGGFLAGARGDRVVRALEAETIRLGGSVRRQPRSGEPELLFFENLSRQQLQAVAAAAGADFSPSAARAIAGLLPSIRDIYRTRPHFDIPREASIERFIPDVNAWEAVNDVQLAGAYRFTDRTVRFAVLADDGLRECDSSVAKYVAAAFTRKRILAYEASQARLVCLLGARPPGLFERSLVMCTGEIATPLSNKTMVYGDVPLDLAAVFATKLSPLAWEN